ncbi:FAS-associated factor 2-like [Corticium candelabrum]|uniref:FAS-associated factor 2-like n=1 Tax=Corticium candelabrum TaxID=121492 RepID=UPI002E26CC44|nr:FAS-associated factor 2-like [Corticium candelabrum]
MASEPSDDSSQVEATGGAESSDDDKSEKLAYFQELTAIGDIERCRATLQQYDWNLEVAVEAVLNMNDSGVDIASTSQPGTEVRQRRVAASLRELAENQQVQQPVHRVVPMQRHQNWSTWLVDLILLPVHYSFSTIWSIFRFLGSFLFPVSQSAIDSIGDVTQFISTFELQYGNSHPEFFRGSYNDALSKARRDIKFMLVYLHSQDHMRTEQFCRNVVCSVGFTEYVNANMIFWACDVNTREGYRVSQVMREATYPFLAILCMQDSRMMIVERIEAGLMDADNVLASLVNAVETNEPSLVAARVDRQQHSASVALREEQDMAYQESLRQDQEKERRLIEQREHLRLEEEERLRKEQEERDLLKSLAEQRAAKQRCLPPEPEAGSDNSTRVVIKLPNGRRLERRFAKTDSLQVLYDYAFCSDETLRNFVLVNSYPRKELHINPDTNMSTLEDFGLIPSASLFVHNESDDADSD